MRYLHILTPPANLADSSRVVYSLVIAKHVRLSKFHRYQLSL